MRESCPSGEVLDSQEDLAPLIRGQGKQIRLLWLTSDWGVSIPAGIKAKEAKMGLSMASKA